MALARHPHVSIGRVCVREVVIAEPDEPAAAVARRMAEHDVGALVVLDAEGRPVGVVTDRDLVIHGVARKRDLEQTPTAAIMTEPVLTVSEDTPIEAALATMAAHRTRRLAVTGADGRLVGIVSMDDVVELLVEELDSIGRILARRPARLET